MTQQPFEHQQSGNVLQQIREGMAVYDRSGDRIGTVADISFGASGDSGVETATAPPVAERDETFIDNLAEALVGDDDIPQEVREKLRHSGYIRIDAWGIFTGDRYVLADQIDGVVDDEVRLRVMDDELIKR